MQPHKIVSEKEWLAARKDLLAKEKEFTQARDALSAGRRALPWVKVEKPYIFDTPQGKKSLAELFGGKSQLIVYHFMLGPGWEEGCPSCSYLADHFGSDFNFAYHVSFSKDELAKGKIYYNYDSVEDPAYQNDELPGASVFYRDANGTVFHTYSAYARGLDILVGTYNLLDLTPKGRDEDELPWTMAWVRHHDKYEDSAKSESRCGAEHRKDDAA
jgi:predicted dithiol-disulfide oxidoreductase (DUF899 family)